MNNYVYLNGRFLEGGRAICSSVHGGSLFSKGVFTTIRVDRGVPEFLENHLKRLSRDSQSIGIDPPKIYRDDVFQLIALNSAHTAVWRLKIVIFVEQQTISRFPSIYIEMSPYIKGPDVYSLFEHVGFVERPHRRIKSLLRDDYDYAKKLAISAGYSDAVLRNSFGIVLETTSANLFWVEGERCFFPDPSLPYLQGVLWNALREKIDPPPLHTTTTFDDISESTSLFVSNSLIHFKPVVRVGGRKFERNLIWEEKISSILKDFGYSR